MKGPIRSVKPSWPRRPRLRGEEGGRRDAWWGAVSAWKGRVARWGRAAAAALLCGALLPAAGCASRRPPAQKLPLELLKNHRRRPKEAATTATIVGVVLAPDGAPLDFALVSAVNVLDDPEAGRPPLLTTALRRGKFALENVPPGSYGLTVTAPAANAVRTGPDGRAVEGPVLAGSYAGVVVAQAGETGPPILLRLRPEAAVFRGRVTDEAGAPLAGALVRAVRESPFEGDHFFAKTDDRGGFVLGVPEGRYFLVGEAPDRLPVRVDVGPDIVIRLPPVPPLPEPEEVAAWVAGTGGVLASADAEGAGDGADLAKLRGLVGDARVVGFGEASYTGGEMARLRLRMLRRLVEEMGFSALLVEAGQADVRALDEHVRTGKGDAGELLRALGYFSLDTEEMAATIAWMRQYNEDRRHRTKLRIFGVDVQRTGTAASSLEDFLFEVDRTFAATVETTLDRLRLNEHGSDLRGRPADEQLAVLEAVEAVAARLDRNRRIYIAKTSWAEYTQAREDAEALVEAVRVVRDDRHRAAAMAGVATRALASLPAGTRAVLWAHATQVSRRAADGGMGAILAGALKKDYVALGMTFYQGWIRAWDFTGGPTLEHGTKLFRLPPAEPGTLEALLETAGAPMFFADVRGAKGALLPWFEARIPMRSAGAVFVADRRARARTVVKEAFDGLVFVRKLTTVHFNESGRRPAQRAAE